MGQVELDLNQTIASGQTTTSIDICVHHVGIESSRLHLQGAHLRGWLRFLRPAGSWAMID